MKLNRKKQNKGFILITALWLIIIVSALTTYIYTSTKLQLRISKHNYETVHSDIIFENCISQIAYDITHRKNISIVKSSDKFFNPDYNPTENFTTKYKITLLAIQDEESLININNTSKTVLESIFNKLDIDENAVPSLMDWIDEDDDDTNNGNGAENEYYNNLEEPYFCKNSPLTSINELFFIRNIGSDWTKLKNSVTIYGDGKININTATTFTLECIGFPSSLIEKITSYIAGADGILHTDDDNYFNTPEEIIEKLEEFGYIEEDERQAIQNNLSLLKTNSEYFRIKIRITINKYYLKDFEAIIKTNGQKWKIIQIIKT